VVRSGSS